MNMYYHNCLLDLNKKQNQQREKLFKISLTRSEKEIEKLKDQLKRNTSTSGKMIIDKVTQKYEMNRIQRNKSATDAIVATTRNNNNQSGMNGRQSKSVGNGNQNDVTKFKYQQQKYIDLLKASDEIGNSLRAENNGLRKVCNRFANHMYNIDCIIHYYEQRTKSFVDKDGFIDIDNHDENASSKLYGKLGKQILKLLNMPWDFSYDAVGAEIEIDDNTIYDIKSDKKQKSSILLQNINELVDIIESKVTTLCEQQHQVHNDEKV